MVDLWPILTFKCPQGDYQVLWCCFTGTLLKISSCPVGTAYLMNFYCNSSQNNSDFTTQIIAFM